MKKIAQKIIVILSILILLSISNISIAVTQSEINSQKEQQSQIQNQLNEAEKKHQELENKKSEAMKQVESISSQIQGYESQINELESKISDANNQIEEQQNKLEKAQKKYEEEEELIKQRMVAIYKNGETSYLDFLLSSKNLTDFISSYYLVEQITAMDEDLLEKIQKQKEEIEATKKQIEESKKQLTETKQSKEKISAELKSAKSEKDKYVAELSEEEKVLEQEIQEYKAENARMQSIIREAEAKYQQQLQQLQGSGTVQPAGSGYLSRPVSGTVTATAYYSSGKFHGAIDYGIPVGTPIYAAAEGVVMSTANLATSYGTYVVIRHPNGLQTYYCHGTYGSIRVSPGQIVSRGQQIMSSGNTGNSTGPHLHFEVRVSPYSYNGYATAYGQDSRVNPYNYM